MRASRCSFLLLAIAAVSGNAEPSPRDRATAYLLDLLKLDTTNPPGNETRVAEYLKREADKYGIPAELVGPDRTRLNFIARLKGSGSAKPLLLMAHTDVVPVDRSQWTVDAFAGVVKDGVIYGRGAEDVKSLLAAELAVLVELKLRGTKLDRDIILLAEADEEAGGTGMTWVVQNAFSKIDAEFALNEMAQWVDVPSGERLFQIQTSEKIPTRIRLNASGTAGHGSLPRPDNPVAHLARAITRLVEADQPVAFNPTTRTYFDEIAKLQSYSWLAPLLPRLTTADAASAVHQIRERDPELDAMLHTTVSPTMLDGGVKVNVIPNEAHVRFDVRRLPTETAEELYERFRRIVNDPAVAVEPADIDQKPPTEPSSLTSPLYLAMKRVFEQSHPRAVVVPLLMRGATDSSYLRAKGIAAYGVPLFGREGEARWHGNDERISVRNLQDGTETLLKIVMAVAAR